MCVTLYRHKREITGGRLKTADMICLSSGKELSVWGSTRKEIITSGRYTHDDGATQTVAKREAAAAAAVNSVDDYQMAPVYTQMSRRASGR